MAERGIDGSGPGPATVCLTDGVGEISDEFGRPAAPTAPVATHLRPSEAREPASCLLEPAEPAERRTEARG